VLSYGNCKSSLPALLSSCVLCVCLYLHMANKYDDRFYLCAFGNGSLSISCTKIQIVAQFANQKIAQVTICAIDWERRSIDCAQQIRLCDLCTFRPLPRRFASLTSHPWMFRPWTISPSGWFAPGWSASCMWTFCPGRFVPWTFGLGRFAF